MLFKKNKWVIKSCMRVTTQAGSTRLASRSNALLEYIREKLSAVGVEVCHWHLQNFTSHDLAFDNPALQALIG